MGVLGDPSRGPHSGWLALRAGVGRAFNFFLKPSNSITLCFSANVINDCKSWQNGSFLKNLHVLREFCFLSNIFMIYND